MTELQKGIPLIDQHDENGYWGGKFGGSFIPETYGDYEFLDPFENPASAQFHHRHLALLTTIYIKYTNFKNVRNLLGSF